MIAELLLATILQIIQTAGYFGVFILMAAESTFLPVPSEAVLPFAGYLVAQGQYEFWLTLTLATMGTIIGSLISYYIGRIFGKTLIEKYGKYVFIKKEEVELAEKWFNEHGNKTIFVCRFIPVVRHVISLPAGMAKMRKRKFIAYTAWGGVMWNAILLIAGIQLQQNWKTIIKYTEYIDVVVVLLIIFGIAYFVAKRKEKPKKKRRKNR
jgi:membrane protein DedA with SNARE-associated domain